MKITLDVEDVTKDTLLISALLLCAWLIGTFISSNYRKVRVFFHSKNVKTLESKKKTMTKLNISKSSSNSNEIATIVKTVPISPVSSMDSFTVAERRYSTEVPPDGLNESIDSKESKRSGRASIRLRACVEEQNPADEPSSDFEISYTKPPSKVKFEWITKPSTVLIVKKWKDPEISKQLMDLANWLETERGMKVIVEKDTQIEFPNLTAYENINDVSDDIDLIVCLGGDGTVLYVSSLFQKSVPPLVAFNMGSFGFLTPFNFKSFREDLRFVLKGQFYIKLRTRLQCSFYKKGQLHNEYQVLNEMVVDRGNSPFLTKLECYCDDRLITTVQADGIIVATATGSTAYSLSAGGSLIHPMLPAILFTPICPHTLSFRPVVLPASCTMKIRIPEGSLPASVSYDGRNRHIIEPGDYLVISISKWPFPTVTRSEQIGEWFQLLANQLNWNKRIQQKARPEEKTSVRTSL